MSDQVLVPYFAYADAARAIEFLVEAFGFDVERRYDQPDGTVLHAELRVGGDRIMLGSTGPGQRSHAADAESPGHGTYVVVDDVDGHHARAAAAGATIVYGPEATDFGTRRYRARDPEGYEWSFGTYRPGGDGER
jgi:uncharacterized glyoxalase superfamily protein PhnB